MEVTHSNERRERVSLAVYLERLALGATDPGYLRDWKIANVDRALFDHLPDLPHFAVDLLKNEPTTQDYLKEIFIGPCGSSTFMHVDVWQSHSWMLVLRGKKKWTMCPPDELQRVGIKRGRDLVSFKQQLAEKIVGMRRYEFDLSAGEIVFVPSGWWHQVVNLEPSIAVTYNFVDAYSLGKAYRLAEKKQKMFDSMVDREVEKMVSGAISDSAKASAMLQVDALASTLDQRSSALTERARVLREQAAALRGLIAGQVENA